MSTRDAWAVLAQCMGALLMARAMHDDATRSQVLAAARDGKRIKDALERGLELDPGIHDAWFGIGLYHYYADVAPAAAKIQHPGDGVNLPTAHTSKHN